MAITYKCAGRARGVCDYTAEARWIGKCPGCNRFYSIDRIGRDDDKDAFKSLADLMAETKAAVHIPTGVKAFDRILGGGIVETSPILISGKRGTGKSTLLLQVACNWAQGIGAPRPCKVLYVAGEQPATDIAMYAKRMGVVGDNVQVMGMETDVYKMCERAEEVKAKLMILDSLQTSQLTDVEASEGSASQMKEVMNFLQPWAKREKITFIAVCHTNRAGEMAGPETVAHYADVLVELWHGYEEGVPAIENKGLLQLGCLEKNRWGEIGVTSFCRMTPTGIEDIDEARWAKMKKKQSKKDRDEDDDAEDADDEADEAAAREDAREEKRARVMERMRAKTSPVKAEKSPLKLVPKVKVELETDDEPPAGGTGTGPSAA